MVFTLNIFSRLILYFHTLKYLKRSQVSGRIVYAVRKKLFGFPKYFKSDFVPELKIIELAPGITRKTAYKAPDTFIFLNVSHSFEGKIDWNHNKNGKLWTYNLNYFDFLNQEGLTKEEGLQLLNQYIASEKELKDGKEPYPVSLRVVNWLKFVYKHSIDDSQIIRFIYDDIKNLEKNLEYHLLGNHLLENAMALTIGGYCLNLDRIHGKGKKLLVEQLEEQICKDGAHYELSPMYHAILLERLLDVINFLNVEGEFLNQCAEKMLSWQSNMTFQNGEMPYVNDAAPGISASHQQIKEYASLLGVTPANLSLCDSGYRKFISPIFELLMDAGTLGPDYHTGHGHNDAGSFLINHKNKPFIVDTAISTYDPGKRRLLEKSVVSHNTTQPVGIEPSEIWKSFRTARRERVSITSEGKNTLSLLRKLPYREKHSLERVFNYTQDRIEILDKCTSLASGVQYMAYLHFSPEVKLKLERNTIDLGFARIVIEGSDEISILDCSLAYGYNRLINSKKAEIHFKSNLKTTITFHN